MLDFAKTEKLPQEIDNLSKEIEIPADSGVEEVARKIGSYFEDASKGKRFDFLLDNVPYRFLSPWITTKTSSAVMAASQLYKNECPYKLEIKDNELSLRLNESWLFDLDANFDYFQKFTLKCFSKFLQSRNSDKTNIYQSISNRYFATEICQCAASTGLNIVNEQHLDYKKVEDTVSSSEITYNIQIPNPKPELIRQIQDTFRLLKKHMSETESLKTIHNIYCYHIDEICDLCDIERISFDKKIKTCNDPITQDYFHTKLMASIPFQYQRDFELYVNYKVRFDNYSLSRAVLEALGRIGLPKEIQDNIQHDIEILFSRSVDKEKSCYYKTAYRLLDYIAKGDG